MKRVGSRRRQFTRAPLLRYKPLESPCFEALDSSTLRLPATFLVKGNIPRDPQSQAARLSTQFIRQNRGALNDFGVFLDSDYDGNSTDLVFRMSTKIGAVPLLSPTTGKPDYGLVVKPRFGWNGIGPMLGEMGWRIIPTPLKLPLLPRSDKKVPPWVLSTIVLFRIKAMLDHLERRFEFNETDLQAPRGTVNWSCYAMSRIPATRFLDVPCRYPDLRDDQELKSAIHFTLKKQLASLETQRIAGTAVMQLISLCQSLLQKVNNYSPKKPTSLAINSWYKGSFRTEVFRDGLQAVEWTNDERGLAGIGDFEGLPWVMCMENFFEAWLETVIEALIKKIGGTLRTGRKRETISSLAWNPPYMGSQKYLLPDLVLERENETIIIDAKYKGHWEEMNKDNWVNLNDELRRQHRADLLQVLAYSTIFSTKKVVVCLAYPCKVETWMSLKKRARLHHHAQLSNENRRIDVILTAVPMMAGVEQVAQSLLEAIKETP